MKKVIVLATAIALLATPAFAAIRNSKHDLSSSSAATVKSTNIDESCVFCHTPHGGTTGFQAPLWNRSGTSASTWSATDLYNSSTLDSASSPTTVLSKVNASDAPLCYSCHDGTSLAGGLNNPPASASNAQPTFTAPNDVVGAQANLNDGSSALKNDHPIGMDYGTVQTNAGANEFVVETTPNQFVDVLPLFTSTGVMWCSSCHDVHNQGAGQPLLVKSNAGSALCTTCHVK
ncbi:cytochrome c3 family protein [Desulfuromonas carbonis]|uniref:cytochrome c3 family protein n=1 Tax=Desulfuromonas sp. DDH964 TaxID=1823759 RepID=UPI00078C5662|nr:cytochrome c3 family protein [Desulfuromonas sp. DDH964]AMV73157.1 putative extracellular tetraheme cytochrome c [Desulfuromonas sp. DDH964]